MGLSSLLRNFLIGVPIGITFLDTVGYVARVEGVSMQPALNPDVKQTDYVFLNRWAVRSYNIQHGDIVIFVSPKFPSQKLIKRVVGLSGDIVTTIGYKAPVVEVHFSCKKNRDRHILSSALNCMMSEIFYFQKLNFSMFSGSRRSLLGRG